MKKVVSFCIYGSNKKYLTGLIKNLEIINEKLPDFETWIYCGKSLDHHFIETLMRYNNVNIIRTDVDGHLLKCYRYFSIDHEDVSLMICRDANSRIIERDLWTIDQFIRSNKLAHIVRDHYWHKRRIPSGICGFRKMPCKIKDLHDNWIKIERYTIDEDFLERVVYPLINHDVLIHSNIVGFIDENVSRIVFPLRDSTMFIGNVLDENDKPEFDYYDFPLLDHLTWLMNQKQWSIMDILTEHYDLDKFSEVERYTFLNRRYVALYYLGRFQDCQAVLKKHSYTHVDDFLIENSNHIIPKLGKKIIGTTDISREPNCDEIVICYGNFHHCVDNLPHSNKMYRHPIYMKSVKHDLFECDSCWDKIDVIYILNLIDRKDRYMEILLELCRMNTPLNKIFHYQAEKKKKVKDEKVNSYLGASKNHIDVIRDFMAEGYNYCMILEDDLTFTSLINQHKKDLATFFDRQYDFDICLISSSKYHEIKPHDDLLDLSYQICTTSSGYILRKDSAKKVFDCLYEGYKKLKETGDRNTYTCDRYWSKLQKDNKFFVFKNKFGYQRPNYSSIMGKSVCYFD